MAIYLTDPYYKSKGTKGADITVGKKVSYICEKNMAQRDETKNIQKGLTIARASLPAIFIPTR